MSKTPYLMGDSSMMMKSFKPKDHTRYKAKGFTFMASLFSFFICTSIFYLLNHSTNSTLTSLLNNNIFWFFMSNTLILFLAADYEAFSSSSSSSSSHSCKTHQDHYEEYDKHSQATRNYNHYVLTSKYEQVDEKPCVVVDVPPKQELLPEEEETVPNDHVSEFVPERVLEIVPQNDPKKPPPPPPSSSKLEKPVQDDSNKNIKACKEKTLYPVGRTVGRSKSDRFGHVSKRVVIDERRNKVIRRTETMKVEEARVEENNDFSSMSKEELNRRVEEFIQRFNRQIRLQAVRNSIVHEA